MSGGDIVRRDPDVLAAWEITAGRENGRQRPKGYADWRPQAKTRALLDQVESVLTEATRTICR